MPFLFLSSSLLHASSTSIGGECSRHYMTDHIKKHGSTSYVGMGEFQNSVLYIRYKSMVYSTGVSLRD